MKAYKHLVKHALKAGHTVSVWDGEEWQVKRSTAYKSIIEAIESVEEAELRIRDTSENVQMMGWARVSAFGLDDDETVSDHTVNEFMEAWWDSYTSSLA